ncbi:MAG: 16S rRNA (guanine(527)-N(7))-methyltransferase RsmG [Candidatus Margulisbacteria bacterium]|nr:16S rRNA (guanine(527)-N(7))-methyltransferase RsmG [Candidatus Margulisiibacteriota bacterium]
MPNEEAFNIYLKELLEWNKKFNLTAITDPEEVKVKHFEDSLSILRAIQLTHESVVDIGSGAGFPGIPLKINCPGIKLTLIEAKEKKVNFLKHIVSLLELNNTEILWGRSEELLKQKQKKLREHFDVALARAIAELPILVEYALPFVKIGGIFIAMKSKGVEAEVKTAEKAIKTLGGRLKNIQEVRLPSLEIPRALVIIEKVSVTPSKFPRRPGMAAKKPLA